MTEEELKLRVAHLEEQAHRLNYAVTKMSVALACVVAAFEKPSAFVKGSLELAGHATDDWNVEDDLQEAVQHAQQAMDALSGEPETG